MSERAQLSEDTRTIEVALDIDATVSRVWKALTDPEELARWFPLIARVQPGGGGSIELSWGPEMRGRNAVLVWKPDRHLRTKWWEQGTGADAADAPADGSPADPRAWARLTVDFYLEEKGDRTLVRMVHSGFSKDASWDEEFEGHSRGWTFELRSLKNYLEHHLDSPRHVAWCRRPADGGKPAAWSRLTGPDCMLREGSLDGLRPGDAYAITTAAGDRFEGRVILNLPPTEFAGTVDNLDHALLRFGVENYGRGPETSIWLSTWGADDPAEPYRHRFTELLS